MTSKLVKVAAGIGGAVALPAAAIGIPAMASASVKPPAKVHKTVRLNHGTPVPGATVREMPQKMRREMLRELHGGHGIRPANCQGWYLWAAFSNYDLAASIGYSLQQHDVIADYNVDSEHVYIPGSNVSIVEWELEVLDTCH